MNNTGSISNQAAPGKNPRLVLFDFDGTLTRGDSFGAFMWYAVPLRSLISGCFKLLFQLPWLLLAPPKIRAERAKAAILRVYFGGKTRHALHEMGLRFYQNRLPAMLRPQLLEILRQHRDSGDTVALVSASVDIWLQAFCDVECISLICTMLAYEEDVFRGNFATPNCNREEKSWRIRETYELRQFNTIIAYGNSSGDNAMFDLATEVWFCSRNGVLEKLR